MSAAFYVESGRCEPGLPGKVMLGVIESPPQVGSSMPTVSLWMACTC